MQTEHEDINPKEKVEMLLDANKEAEQYEFYMVGDTSPSPSAKLYAYSIDIKGNESYYIYVKVHMKHYNEKLGIVSMALS